MTDSRELGLGPCGKCLEKFTILWKGTLGRTRCISGIAIVRGPPDKMFRGRFLLVRDNSTLWTLGHGIAFLR